MAIRRNDNGTVLNRPQTQKKRAGVFGEIGTSGIEAWSGIIRQAYIADLTWPSAWPTYSRLYRADDEITIIRQGYTMFARRLDLTVEPPKDPSDDDLAVAEYGLQMFGEMEGGSHSFIETVIKTAFYGWTWFETVMGMRNGRNFDGWVSQYDDGLPAIRKLAFRDHSSFVRWDMDDATGTLHGMEQMDAPNPSIVIPLDRSIHVTYGDPSNPEGLSPMEALYRLERIKWGLTNIFGIGSEHTAGHLSVTSEKPLGDLDTPVIRQAAQSIQAAQENNFAMWPPGVNGELIDTPFSAAAVLLEGIKHWGMLKLQIYNMQHVAMSTTSGAGSFAAMSDASAMAVMMFNGMMEGMFKQVSQQVGEQLFNHPLVRKRYPGMTGLPTVGVTKIEKSISLTELSTFANQMFPIMPMGDDDIIAIRKKSEFLPTTLPEETAVSPTPPASQPDDEPEEGEPDEDDSAEFHVSDWWALRQEIFTDRNLQQDDLIKLLDAATTRGDLKMIRHELAQSKTDKKIVNDYGDEIALLVMKADDRRLTKQEFIGKMRETVFNNIELMFRRGANIDSRQLLLPHEIDVLNEELETHFDSIEKMADELYDNE